MLKNGNKIKYKNTYINNPILGCLHDVLIKCQRKYQKNINIVYKNYFQYKYIANT